MDIMGPFPKSRQTRYIIVATDYFTKWIEAEAYAMIKAIDMKKLHLEVRHLSPRAAVQNYNEQRLAIYLHYLRRKFCAK